MKRLNERKSAMVSTELAVSLVLVTVALLFTLGMFGDSLKATISGSNFNNMFKGNYNNTFFSFFKRDYSNSQIDVQVMSAEGLAVIRQKANNGSIEIIDGAYGRNSLTLVEADTISYLVQIINIIVGSPEICEYMEQPSIERCEKIVNLGTKYQVSMGTNAITVTRKSDGKTLSAKRSQVEEVSVEGGSDDFNKVYDAIALLVKKYDGKINQKYALTREISSWNPSAKLPTKGSGSRTLEAQLRALLGILLSNAKNSSLNCNDWKAFTGNLCDALGSLCPDKDVKCSDNSAVYGDALEILEAWIAAIEAKIDSITNVLPTPSPAVLDNPKVKTTCSTQRINGRLQEVCLEESLSNLYKQDSSLTAQAVSNYPLIDSSYYAQSANNNLVAGSEDALLIANQQALRADNCSGSDNDEYSSCGGGGDGGSGYSSTSTGVPESEIPKNIIAYKTDLRLSTIRNRVALTQVREGYQNMANLLGKSYTVSIGGKMQTVSYTDIMEIINRDKTGKTCNAFVTTYDKIMKDYGLTEQKINFVCRVSSAAKKQY